MTRMLLNLFLLFIIFLVGVLIGRMIENRSNRKTAQSKLLMETYDTLLNDFVEKNTDIATFFERNKVAIYGLRGKYGHDFFEMIKGDVLVNVIYSDGNADTMNLFKGKKVYTKRELIEIDFDYLIILPLNHFSEIYDELLKEGIERDKICSMVDIMYYMRLGCSDV